ncbi:MAG: FHA domain-containing protein [Bdellovibrionales bacterium]|nr:FHA domain-containing protein [Bdellovibrionales bacterium]
MGEVIFIEVLDKHDRVKERHRCDSFPINLGRSYTNDVIISDAQVCPEHLVISRDESGILWAQDLGSVNGIVRAGTADREIRVRIECDTKILLGGVTIRFRTQSYKVADTVPSSMQGIFWRSAFLSRRNAALASLLMVIVTMVFVYQGYIETLSPMRYFNASLVVLFPSIIIVLVWAGIWSLISRVVHLRSYFIAHFTIGFLALSVWFVLTVVVEYIRFSFSSNFVGSLAGYSSTFAVVTAVLFGHLSFCSTKSVYSRLAKCGGFSGLLVGVAFLMSYTSGDEFSTELDFGKELKPPMFVVSGSEDLETFFERAEFVKRKVDQLSVE